MLETILILLISSLLLPVSAVAQNTHATRIPIRVISTAPIVAREINLLRFDFQELYYGFEGSKLYADERRASGWSATNRAGAVIQA